MPKPFLLESFEKHKERGIALFRQGDLEESKYHFLKAAEYLLELAQQTTEPKLKATRTKNAMDLVTLAKTLKEKRKALREKAASRGTSGKKSDGGSDDEVDAEGVPTEWLAEKPKVRFSDIAGLEDVKEQIRIKMIFPFTHPEKAKKYRVKTGGGILLYGPPGTGKTLIAKAIAGELDATFFAIAPSEILNKWVGESEKNIRKLFDAARKSERAVIFLDEVESLTPPRRDSDSGGVMQRVVPQILNELDGFDRKEGHTLLFLGATNEPWSIDTAMMRPGRLDEKIYIGLPDAPARKKILEMNLKEIPLDDDVDLDALTDRLDGYSGADIAYVCRKVSETAFEKAVAKDLEAPISMRDFDQVLHKLKPSVSHIDLDRFKKFRGGMMRAVRPFLLMALMLASIALLLLNLRERDLYNGSPKPIPAVDDEKAPSWLPEVLEHPCPHCRVCRHRLTVTFNEQRLRLRDRDGWYRLFWAGDDTYFYSDGVILAADLLNPSAADPAGEWVFEVHYKPIHPSWDLPDCGRMATPLRLRFKLEVSEDDRPPLEATAHPIGVALPRTFPWFVYRYPDRLRHFYWSLVTSD